MVNLPRSRERINWKSFRAVFFPRRFIVSRERVRGITKKQKMPKTSRRFTRLTFNVFRPDFEERAQTMLLFSLGLSKITTRLGRIISWRANTTLVVVRRDVTIQRFKKKYRFVFFTNFFSEA